MDACNHGVAFIHDALACECLRLHLPLCNRDGDVEKHLPLDFRDLISVVCGFDLVDGLPQGSRHSYIHEVEVDHFVSQRL